ncbi:MAG: Phasin [Cypionkella sp.]|nr:Phasin [Cypionkella sp.]
MANNTDFTKVMQDMMASFPVDASAFQNAFKAQAAFGEKLSAVALQAAEKSTEISSKWAKETLTKLSAASKAKAEPTDYSKAASDFASAAAEMAAENMAAFAEVAKKVQMETVELMMAAGKDASAEATAVVKKATDDATAAVKKATDDVTAAAKKATVAAK